MPDKTPYERTLEAPEFRGEKFVTDESGLRDYFSAQYVDWLEHRSARLAAVEARLARLLAESKVAVQCVDRRDAHDDLMDAIAAAEGDDDA